MSSPSTSPDVSGQYKLPIHFGRRREPPSLHRSSVLRRTGRRCRERGFALRQCRPSHARHCDLGDLYTVDLATGEVKATHVRLEQVAIALGIISPGEEIIT
jgi:hypothetical protein